MRVCGIELNGLYGLGVNLCLGRVAIRKFNFSNFFFLDFSDTIRDIIIWSIGIGEYFTRYTRRKLGFM